MNKKVYIEYDAPGWYCPECGGTIKDNNDQFCPHCDTYLYRNTDDDDEYCTENDYPNEERDRDRDVFGDC